ncbi:MAG: pantetheine-phosphate adenylyltransferase [Bacteroidales bacterium]|nr:pantetheine-phosphate adenylyltransferase [Bacteroidales bacterium]MBO7487120.1 pantetheine-phosphate adenylyltransferase [Bacteroidales bacterium]
MKTALFPGSFDPFTLGHLDVLQSALKLFDKVIVAVGYNYNKKGFFPLDIRVEIIKDAIKGLDNVEVRAFDGLTVDFCKKVGANCIIRGIRTTTDFELESVIAQANKQMAPEISSVFIPSSHDYSFISSTVVRDVLINGGDARCFLPKNVDITKYLEYLEK